MFQRFHAGDNLACSPLTPSQAANCSICEILAQTSSVKAGRERVRTQFPENPLEPPLRCQAPPIQGQAFNQYNTFSIVNSLEEVKRSGGRSNLIAWHQGESSHQVFGQLLMASGCVPFAEATPPVKRELPYGRIARRH